MTVQPKSVRHGAGGLEYKWRHQAELCKSVAVNMDDRVLLKRHNSFVSQQLNLFYPKISQKLATNSPKRNSVKSTNWACNPGSSRELAKETLLRSTLTWKLLNPFLISVMPAGWTSTDLPLVASKPTPQNKLLIMWQWTKKPQINFLYPRTFTRFTVKQKIERLSTSTMSYPAPAQSLS